MEQSNPGRKRRSQRDYSLAFKLMVVQEVEKGALNYLQAQRKYGIQGASTVLVWLRKHGNLDWGLHRAGENMALQEKTPEQRIKELEAELELEKQKNLLLTTVINIAEKQYGVPIKKKLSPKLPDISKKKKS